MAITPEDFPVGARPRPEELAGLSEEQKKRALDLAQEARAHGIDQGTVNERGDLSLDDRTTWGSADFSQAPRPRSART